MNICNILHRGVSVLHVSLDNKDSLRTLYLCEKVRAVAADLCL